jgi:heavy metal translocating P-type ATPase
LDYTSPWFWLCVVGAIPVIVQMARDIGQGNWSTDLIALVSILTGIVMGQYLVAGIIIVMLAGGGLLERYAVRKASGALAALAKRVPTVAHRLDASGSPSDVLLTEIQIGDELLLLPHELCPADGVVSKGNGRMDESFLTGEPYEVQKAPGVTVISGAQNADSLLQIRVSRRPQDSRYAQIISVMKDSEMRRPAMRRLADQLGAWYTPIALLIAALAGYLAQDWNRFLAVVVVATPCPLLIAIPVALLGAISQAAKRGIIIRDPAVLEQLDRVQTFIFDKTGTLTHGKPVLLEHFAAPGAEPDEVLRTLASLERYSKHPLAKPVLEAAAKKGLALLDAEQVSEEAGRGIEARIGGVNYQVVSRKKIPAGVALPPLADGQLECLLLREGQYWGAFHFFDAPRPDTQLFLQHLGPRHGGRRTVLLTGDQAPAALLLAQQVGIGEVFASQSPEQKVEFVRAATAQGPTLFVGDGINDAPALMQATVGISFGSASNVTSEAAAAVILEPSLAKIDELLHIGRRLRRIALQSVLGGLGVSILGMGFAAFGWLSPLYGAILQEVVDVASVLNALRTTMGSDGTDYETKPT